MGNRLYVGNLPYALRDDELKQAFSAWGSVTSAHVMLERDTGRSKGFGFVEMADPAQAEAAMAALHGQPLGGRNLVVNVARPIAARPPRTPSGRTTSYAGRRDNGFRNPYSTGSRQRAAQTHPAEG